MNFSKYKKLIILFVVYIVFWIILISILEILFRPEIPIALTRFIPLDDILLELGIIFIIILPLSAFTGLLIGGYLISPIILYLHIKFYGSKMYYGIQVRQRSEKISLFSQSFFPILMAINLSSLLFTPTVIEFILSTDVTNIFEDVSRIPMLTRFFADAILLIVTFGLATMFFSSIWFLNDSGIIYSNKQKIENSSEPIILRSIGEWFQIILRSYAGIGAIITYILVVYDFITRFVANLGLPGNTFNIPTLILWLGMPIYLTISLIPTVIINDIMKSKRISYIKKISRKLGIKDTAIISFEFKRQMEY
ncbi:MAG: hypothetical protein JSV62_08275 [Promethearchaeota archaeon]|nr:MAG: hypothetical protein JSV62_08275 [Candidatus Lokiarchaeota archaeon]